MKPKSPNKPNNQNKSDKSLDKDILTFDAFTRLLGIYKARVYEHYYPLS